MFARHCILCKSFKDNKSLSFWREMSRRSTAGIIIIGDEILKGQTQVQIYSMSKERPFLCSEPRYLKMFKASWTYGMILNFMYLVPVTLKRN